MAKKSIEQLMTMATEQVMNVINPGGVSNKTEGELFYSVLEILKGLVEQSGSVFNGVIKTTSEAPSPSLKGNLAFISSQTTAGTYKYTNYGNLSVTVTEEQAPATIFITRVNGVWASEIVPLAMDLNHLAVKAEMEQAIAQLEQETSGILLAEKRGVISNGNYRKVFSDIPMIDNDNYGYVIVKGIDGYLYFSDSNWSEKSRVYFEDGNLTDMLIPKNCPNVIVFAKDNSPVSIDTEIHLAIYEGGQKSEIFNNNNLINALQKKTHSIVDLTLNGVYAKKSDARQSILKGDRSKGKILMYQLLDGTLCIEQYVGESLEDTNWTYGSWKNFGIESLININYFSAKETPYNSKIDARLGYSLIKSGTLITYLLADGWHTEMFIGDTISSLDEYWYEIANIDYVNNAINPIKNIIPNNGIFMFDESYYVSGWWNGTSLGESNMRASIKIPLHVYKGDEISISNGYLFSCSVYEDGINIQSRGYSRLNLYIEDTGKAYITIAKIDDSVIDLSTLDNVLSVKHYGNGVTRQGVEYVSKNSLTKGYINGEHGISPHSKRFVNYQGVKVFKGDLVYSTNINVSFMPNEYNNKGEWVSSPSIYYYAIPSPNSAGSEFMCGAYTVKNDGYIMCQCMNINEPDAIELSDYDNALCVIHMNTDLDMIAKCAKKRTSKSCRKGRDIDLSTNGKYLQGGTFVCDDLWYMWDDYKGNVYIKVINPTNGEEKKSIVCNDISHGNMDYNINNDILIVTDIDHIYLFNNPSSFGNTLSSSDALLILNKDKGASCCWGENERYLYTASAYKENGYEGLTIKKILLGVDSNNNYDGSLKIINIFYGKIFEGIDTYHGIGQGNLNYVQDIEYDGYLYVAIGTMGCNFIVIDLDEDSSTYNVIGNYMWKYYDSSMNECYLEPELLALHNGKIYCGARNYDKGLSSLKEFDRGL